MKHVIEQLGEMDFSYNSIAKIQDENGIIVARVYHNNGTYIIKYFNNSDHRRELVNYKILKELNISTLTIYKTTDCALLMEDINSISGYRLGTADDLNDTEVAFRIANWYRSLHQNGYDYVNYNGANLYDESDFITKENIETIMRVTATERLPVWSLFIENFDEIKHKITRARRTLTYNDFNYTNLIVAHHKSSAFMFDYNLLGKGYAYSDIRNVCSSLGERAKEAFLSGYGSFDVSEIAVDDVASVITTLYLACKRSEFPQWANSTLEILQGDYMDKVKLLIGVGV